jgi:DNA-binding transcriptional LysR family regulator
MAAVAPSTLDLNKLRTFFAITQAGGVSAAAERLGLTRSAVSHSLTSLEDSLDLKLFHRVGKRLLLTREGELLRAAYRDVDERLTTALDSVRGDGAVQGRVRLGLYVGFSRFRLTRVLQRFCAEHEHAGVRIVHGSRAELSRALLAGRLDFQLALSSPPMPASVRSTRLLDQQLLLVNRERPKRSRDPFESIAQLPIIDFFRAEPLIDRWTAHHFGRRRKIDRAHLRVFAASNSDLALELACAGVGATVLPRNLVEPFRRSRQLVVIPGSEKPLRESIWLHELATQPASRLQSAFRSTLVDALGEAAG